jgi:hypothetical protein
MLTMFAVALLGSLLILGLLAILVWFCITRKRRRQQTESTLKSQLTHGYVN